MTHSEKLEKAIYQVKNEIGFYIANGAKEESTKHRSGDAKNRKEKIMAENNMTYEGLKTTDKGALLDAKARGGEWLAREFFSNEIWVWSEKPFKGQFPCAGWYSTNRANPSQGCIGMLNLKIAAVSCEPMNIDLALAQIAEMESAEKPLTWNKRINQMTVEEKATLFQHDDCFIYKLTGTAYCDRHLGCEECTKQFLNSPYTEGETE